MTAGGDDEPATGFYAINVGRLPSLRKFVYHFVPSEGDSGQYVQSSEDICLIIFNKDREAGLGAETKNDLRFETVSFLRYLYEEYGA